MCMHVHHVIKSLQLIFNTYKLNKTAVFSHMCTCIMHIYVVFGIYSIHYTDVHMYPVYFLSFESIELDRK